MNKHKVVLRVVVFLVAALGLAGMFGCRGPGMTKDDVHRRHLDVVDVNTQLIQDDIDKVLMLDQPSRQSEYIVR